MRTRRQDLFQTVRTEGALLPTELLQRVASADGDLDRFAPEAYHLAPGEKLNEAINRSWNRLCGAWAGFRDALERLPDRDHATGVTRERWLSIVFQELQYGRLQAQKATEIDGKAYPVSHMWERTPIHLIGCRVGLDERTAGVAGAARSSPHSLVQELLNRSDDHLWGMVSNGLRLRVLRDNISFTRQAFLEFDLEGMFEGEVYADFALLWLVCHQSRVEGERPDECLLEKWSRSARQRGTRALDQLRKGVQEAITALGRGFLSCPQNTGRREALRSGELDRQDAYRQLLRLVYRLLFLFVAEDRELLLDSAAGDEAKSLYTRHYSTRRLRRLAERTRGTKHVDLYRGLALVMEKLGDDAGCPELGLPALGSFLWSREAVAGLAGCDIANSDLLGAVRALAFTVDGRVLRAVDYKNLGSEELGSVYESLLELHPEIDAGAATFSLETAGGHERKTTGSYYTPESLIQCLLDSALDPVVDEAVAKDNPEQALLDLKVCDPACGSGHFLIAASHRLAKRLAELRTGDEEPSPDAVRTALRDVIGRCIYGVDLNPMAVDLCKVSLWLEALEPGKPLSFLENKILCGNSLLGTTPALLQRGVPDDAFKPIEGDDKRVASAVRKENREFRKQWEARAKAGSGQQGEFEFAPEPAFGTRRIQELAERVDAIGDSSIAAIHRKEAGYRELARSDEYRRERLLADAWCSAFAWKLVQGMAEPPSQRVLEQLKSGGKALSQATIDEIERLADHYQWFHWHLAFSGVFRRPESDRQPENTELGWDGGFDLVLGNPHGKPKS